MDIRYRKVELTAEVESIVNNYVLNQKSVLLWQAFARKQAGYVQIFNYLPETKLLQLNIVDLSFKLDPREPLYLRGQEKQILFKANFLSRSGSFIEAKAPDDYRLQELRGEKRYSLMKNDRAYITVIVPAQESSRESTFALKLNDISRGGCSAWIHSRSLSYFKDGVVLQITQIGSDFVNTPIYAEIRHISKINSLNPTMSNLYKMGLKFDRSLYFPHYYVTKHLQ